MFNLTTQEKKVLIVLSAFAVLGLAVLAYRNYFARPVLKVVASQLKTGKADYGDIISQKAAVNINTADVSKIETLPGIGPQLARDIVDYRAAHGLFLLKEDLKKVKGVGPKKFEQIKELISVQ